MVKLSDIQRLAKEQNFNQERTENMKQISYQQAQNIIDVACEGWKRELFTTWGQDIIFKRKIEITEEFYQKMRKACTAPQNELFDEIFGKQCPYKVGDWVIDKKAEYPARKVSAVNPHFLYFEDYVGTYTFDYCRLATQEEIDAANIIPEGTPCLVRDTKTASWRLVYSNGKGRFKGADPTTYTWEYVQVLDVNNLPKY